MATQSRRLILGLAALAIAPGLAIAQTAAPSQAAQVVATAPAKPAPAPRPPAGGQIIWIAPPTSYPAIEDGPAPTDRNIHGEISVGAGTGGDREISGAASGPIGDTGQASIAFGAGQDDWKR